LSTQKVLHTHMEKDMYMHMEKDTHMHMVQVMHMHMVKVMLMVTLMSILQEFTLQVLTSMVEFMLMVVLIPPLMRSLLKSMEFMVTLMFMRPWCRMVNFLKMRSGLLMRQATRRSKREDSSVISRTRSQVTTTTETQFPCQPLTCDWFLSITSVSSADNYLKSYANV